MKNHVSLFDKAGSASAEQTTCEHFFTDVCEGNA